jgi:hypothetical protein
MRSLRAQPCLKEVLMIDIAFIVLVVMFFVLTVTYARVAPRL